MFFQKHLLFFVVMWAYFTNANIIERTSESYGPYTVAWEQYDSTCRGPKLANLTTYTATTTQDVNGSFIGTLNITFLNNTKVEEVKMSVYTMNGNRKVLLWNYLVSKPCQHYAIRKVFETQLSVENCVVQQGSYFLQFNYTESTRDYLGTSFFYGRFLFKVIVLSKKGNIACLVFIPVFKKA